MTDLIKRIYSPFESSPFDSKTEEKTSLATLKNIPDEILQEYVDQYIENYRKLIDDYFSPLAEYIPFYNNYPFRVVIVRIGSGTLIGFKPSSKASIKTMQVTDFDPPVEMNIFAIQERLQSYMCTADFRIRNYDKEEAILYSARQALNDSLDFYWNLVGLDVFSELCNSFLEKENVFLKFEDINPRFNAVGEIKLHEPGGYRRFEKWGFIYKVAQEDRVSAKYLREIESLLEQPTCNVEVICLITTDDVTSITNYIVVNNPRIRVWDRSTLAILANQHLQFFGDYFQHYKIAIEKISNIFFLDSKYDEFKTKLENCPTGQQFFSNYEDICTEIICYLFNKVLKESKSQSSTADKKHRRDSLFKNLRKNGFFQRIFDKHNADFIIFDYKNYEKPIDSTVLQTSEKYANEFIGNFIVVISRKGAKKSVESVQLRILRDRKVAIVVISDVHLLEMMKRKSNGLKPEDILEDLYDELIRRY
jgi:hypothetical protein